MVTRDDVARVAGVSPSTVSYALSGRRKVSEETRVRILAAMRDLDYTPSAFAKGLAGAQKGIIALNYPVRQGGLAPTEVRYANEVQMAARERGFHVLWWADSPENTDGLRALIGEQIVDGVVLHEVQRGDPRLPLLRERGARFVLLGRSDDAGQEDYVDTDFELAARDALHHLVTQGHRRILHVSDTEEMIARGHGPTVRTREALIRFAESWGIELGMYAAAHSYRGGRDAYASAVRRELRPTAAIVFNDQASIGFLHAAQLDGQRVPEDLSVLAIGMGDDAADLVPGMTTLTPPVRALARIAVGLLVDRIEGHEPLQNQILLRAELHERSSVGPPS